MTTYGSVDGALSAERVRRDLVRLLPLAVLLLALAVLTDVSAVTAFVVAIGALCGVVCAIAAVVALVGTRGRALAAAAMYGIAAVLFAASVVVAVG